MPPTVQLATERTYADVDGTRTLIAVPGQPVPTQFRDLVDPDLLQPLPRDPAEAPADVVQLDVTQIEQLRKEIDAEFRPVLEERDQLRGERDELREELDDARKSIKALEDNLESTQADADREVGALQAKLAESGTPPVAPATPTEAPAPKPAPADGDKAKTGPEHDKARRGARTKDGE